MLFQELIIVALQDSRNEFYNSKAPRNFDDLFVEKILDLEWESWSNKRLLERFLEVVFKIFYWPSSSAAFIFGE